MAQLDNKQPEPAETSSAPQGTSGVPQPEKGPAKPVSSGAESPAKPVVAPEKKRGTILFVEDDLPMLKMYSTKLSNEGFQVEVAHDGEEGWEKIKSVPVNLVLLDLMIPKLGGMALLEKIKADPKLKMAPVIILSNLSQEQDIARAKELGVRSFLIKSNYTPSQVVSIVKEYFKGGKGGLAVTSVTDSAKLSEKPPVKTEATQASPPKPVTASENPTRKT